MFGAESITPEQNARATTSDARRKPREEILAMLDAHSTVTLSALRDQLGMGWGTLYHHVTRMKERGEIGTTVVGRRHLVFLKSGEATQDQLGVRAAGILRGKTARRLAEAIAQDPRRSVADLAAELGISERVAYYHIRRLIAEGLLVSASGTRQLSVQPTTQLTRLLRGARPQDAEQGHPLVSIPPLGRPSDPQRAA